MSALSRRLVSHLRRYIANRRRTKRARVRLELTLSLNDPRISSNGSRRLPSLNGHTFDISNNGIGVVVQAIRIGEHYLVSGDRRLHLKLELPSGPVELNVTPVRYESLEEDPDESGYLIGAHITEVNETDRPRFNEYVRAMLARQQ
jgi:hypothetical protein